MQKFRYKDVLKFIYNDKNECIMTHYQTYSERVIVGEVARGIARGAIYEEGLPNFCQYLLHQ